MALAERGWGRGGWGAQRCGCVCRDLACIVESTRTITDRAAFTVENGSDVFIRPAFYNQHEKVICFLCKQVNLFLHIKKKLINY